MPTAIPRLVLTGVGAVTPLGHDAKASCAAIRARLSALAEHPLFAVETGDPEWDDEQMLKAALVPDLSIELEHRERLIELGLWALRDLVRSAQLRRRELERSALLFALPTLDGVTSTWAFAQLDADLRAQAGLAECAVTKLNHGGHVGVFELLAEAAELLVAQTVEQCVIVASDSYFSSARLALLDQSERLRSERSPDGFFPGEAAVALTVELERPGGRRPLATLSAPGFGREPQDFQSERASSGRGLQLAIDGALGGAAAPARAASWVLCDLNGESYRSFEWGTVRGRLAERFAPDLRLIHPADAIGDVGAASGGLLLACAAQGFERGYAPAREALLWTSSDDAERAALWVEAPEKSS